MGRTACTELQCLYKGALYLYLTVELYLYSPYGPYCLYRASVPVQGYTLPFTSAQKVTIKYFQRKLLLNRLSSSDHSTDKRGNVRINVTFRRVPLTTVTVEQQETYSECVSVALIDWLTFCSSTYGPYAPRPYDPTCPVIWYQLRRVLSFYESPRWPTDLKS